jgi:hypothetical protein
LPGLAAAWKNSGMAKRRTHTDPIEAEVERLERLFRETGDVRHHLQAKMQSDGGCVVLDRDWIDRQNAEHARRIRGG